MHDVFMIHVDPWGSVFSMGLDTFVSRGGFSESWGLHWMPVVATSSESAVEIVRKLEEGKFSELPA
jgi:hypothetical protein